jgi:TRAP-type transport system periplasmic protein
MKRAFLRSLVAVAALAAFGTSFAQERTIKFATQNPVGHPIELGMKKFAEIVQAKSGGKIKVRRPARQRPGQRHRAAGWHA